MKLQRTLKGRSLYFVADAGQHKVGDVIEGGLQVSGLGTVYHDRLKRHVQNCYVVAAPGWRLVDGEPLPVSVAARAEQARMRNEQLADLLQVLDLVYERDVSAARVQADGWRYLADRYVRACMLAERAEARACAVARPQETVH